MLIAKQTPAHRLLLLLFVMVILLLCGMVSIMLADASPALQSAANVNLIVAPRADTFVASGQPQAQFGDLAVLRVGYSESDGRKIQRTLLQFEIPPLPVGSQLQTVTLALYLGGTTPNDAPMNVQAQRILQNWQENITWNEQAGANFADENISALATIGTDFKRYSWDVKPLLAAWLADAQRTTYFGVRLTGAEDAGRRIRAFGAQECTGGECGAKLPELTLFYLIPTPTPIPTATPSPTFVPTAPPPPGMATFTLHSQPPGKIAPGEKLTYTLAYQNGPYTLTNVFINTSLPAQVTLVTGTIRADPGIISTTFGGKIFWTFLQPLGMNRVGQVSYSVQRVDSSNPQQPIFTEGALSTWQYGGTSGENRSNAVRNPPLYLYLPLITRTTGRE